MLRRVHYAIRNLTIWIDIFQVACDEKGTLHLALILVVKFLAT